MNSNEDCASVLEQFMHDVANLPAEINHMMEEIHAKDSELNKTMHVVNSRDGTLQKHIKLEGSLKPHAKESEFADTIRKHFQIASELQTQKVGLSEKACNLLERQIKKLDVKIRDLQTDGQLLGELPSVFTRKQVPEVQKPFADLPLPGNHALQVVTNNALNMNAAAHRMNNQINPQLAQVAARQISQVASNVSAVRSSAPATPSSNLAQHQRHRESSAGASDIKRRKLNTGNSFSASIPTQPSSLRQSSLGPGATASGTPKAGTPTGTSASGARSGSLPRTTGSQQAAATMVKKSGLSKNVAPHQQVSKLKGKAPMKHGRLSNSSAGRKKGVSPSVRSRAGGDDDNDSVLSSADVSDTESQTHTKRGRRSKKDKAAQALAQANVSDQEDVEDEDDQDDNKRYCFCNERSYGEMVACENEKCQYEWFHLACIGLKKAPEEEATWYCPACRVLPEFSQKKGK